MSERLQKVWKLNTNLANNKFYRIIFNTNYSNIIFLCYRNFWCFDQEKTINNIKIKQDARHN